MKNILLIILYIYSINIYSQEIIKSNTSFKLHLLKEGIMILNKKNNNNLLFRPDLIKIGLDTVGDYNTDVLFLRFKLGENLVHSLDENIEVYFNSSSCDEYIMAYNVNNYRSYRLKGFNGNDLLFMLRDINTSSNSKKSYKRLLVKLNNLNIGLNFKDIYKALLNFKFETECLKVCSDGKDAHKKR